MKTIQELIDFFETIPSESWTKNILSSWAGGSQQTPEKNCSMGHLNKHLHGDWGYNLANDSWNLLLSLDLDPIHLININNASGDPKTNVINFLKSKLREVA